MIYVIVFLKKCPVSIQFFVVSKIMPGCKLSFASFEQNMPEMMKIMVER